MIRTNGVGKNYIQGAVKGNFAIQRGERSSWALKVGKECGGRNMRLGVVGENFGLDWEVLWLFFHPIFNFLFLNRLFFLRPSNISEQWSWLMSGHIVQCTRQEVRFLEGIL